MSGHTALDLLSALIVLTVLYCSPTVVLATLLGVILLVPDQLVVPHLFTSTLTVDHVTILATGIRVLVMIRGGELSRAAVRATPVHLALAVLVVVWLSTGVVFAPESADPNFQVVRVVNLAAMVATFLVVLALARALDRPWLVASMLGAGLGAMAAIAIVEHITGASYGHLIVNSLNGGPQALSGNPLEARAGHLRVRASAEFALSFAWVAVMLLPLAIVAVSRHCRNSTRVTAATVVGLAVLAIFWTYTRSALVAVPAAVVVLAVFSRSRVLLRLAGVVLLASVVAVLADPTLRHHLSLSTDAGSVAIRFQRLPLILRSVSAHPFRGLGFGGLEDLSLPTTDNFYLLTYGSTGALGAAALIVVLITSAGAVGRGLMVADQDRRLIIAAAGTGLVGFAASGLFDDALFLNQPAQLAFALLALLIATTEPALGPALMPRFSIRRPLLFAGVGALAGWCLFLASPTSVVQQRSFETVTALRLTAPDDPAFMGNSLIASVCEVARDTVTTRPGMSVSCLDDYSAAGQGTLRIAGSSAPDVSAAFTSIAATLTRATYLAGYQTLQSGAPRAARGSGWRTAPASGGLAGGAAGIIAPLPIRRRRRSAVRPTPVAA